MPPGPACRAGSAPSSGFALLIVLWTLIFIAFIITQVGATGRTELRIARNLAANATTQAAADGAIYEAIFNLGEQQLDRRWLPDGSSHVAQIGQSRIIVRIEDENGFVNPNLASPALLEGLLRALGGEPQKAVDLATAITEWVGSATVRRSPQQLVAEYRAAGLDYAPPMAASRTADDLGAITPLESIDELGRVRGMTPQLVAALRPHLTLFGSAIPNAESADPVVAAAIAFANMPSVSTGADSEFVTARIHAAAQGPGGARVTRVAVARVGRFAARGYSLLAWGSEVE
jgi:general secretion pathway protein K